MLLVTLSTFILWVHSMLFFYAFMKAYGTRAGGNLNFISKGSIHDVLSFNGDKFQELPTKTNRKHAYARIANSLINHSLLVAVKVVIQKLNA